MTKDEIVDQVLDAVAGGFYKSGWSYTAQITEQEESSQRKEVAAALAPIAERLAAESLSKAERELSKISETCSRMSIGMLDDCQPDGDARQSTRVCWMAERLGEAEARIAELESLLVAAADATLEVMRALEDERKRADKAEARIAELTPIEARLQRTLDGKAVFDGDEVWHPLTETGAYTVSGSLACNDEEAADVSECYSTEKAMMKAREERQTQI